MSSSFKLKPLVIAVSAMVGVLSAYPSSAASIEVSTSSSGLSISSSLDWLSIFNTGDVSGTDFGIINTSSIGTLSNAGVITGNDGIYNASSGSINSLSNTGVISASEGTGIWNDAAEIDSVFNSGTISGQRGVYFENGSYLGDFNNQGVITASEDAAFRANDTELCTFQNSGTLSGEQGVVFENDSSLYMLTNSGVITASQNDEDEDDRAAILLNNSSIYSVSNTGYISGDGGIILENDAGIEQLTNDGTISAGLGIGAFADNGGNSSSIGTLYNSGLIDADEGIIVSDGSYLGTLTNSGTINAGLGIGAFGYEEEENASSIGTIINNGLIDAEDGIIIAYNASLGGLSNVGTIDAETGVAVYDSGTISSINNSGVISGASAALVNGNGNMGPITNSGTIYGNVYSNSGLTFYGFEGEGMGTLTGYGDDTIGTISIAAGDLVFADGNMLLNDNITLGEGQLSVQDAFVQINNVLTVDGDYQQSSNADVLFGVTDYLAATGDITSYNGYGRLVISGSANIASGAGIGLTSLNDYAFAQGQRYVVMQANSSGTNFNANDLDYWADGYTGLLSGSAVTDATDSNLTDLVVTLGDCNGNTAPIGYANTNNAVSSLGGLFNYGGTDAKLLNVFNASAALGSTAAANRAGAQLSPAAVASAAAQASAAPSVAVINVIAERGEAIRLAGDGARGVATGEGEGPVAWGQGFGGSVDQGNRYGISGYDATYGGLLLGGDGAINDEWRLGGLGSYANTLVDSKSDNAGSSVRVNSWGMFGYANYDGHPWIMNLSTGAVRHQYDTHRHIAFTGFNGDATGSFHGMQYIAAGQVGYPMPLGASGALLTPLAGMTYSLLNQDGYTESGGNGAGLTVDSATSTSLKSDIGFKLEKSFEVSSGIVHPFMQLGWRHEYHDTALQSIANFSADSSGATSFATQGLRSAADSGVWSVGAMMVGKHNLSLTLKYTGEAARNYQSHTGNVQLRWQF